MNLRPEPRSPSSSVLKGLVQAVAALAMGALLVGCGGSQDSARINAGDPFISERFAGGRQEDPSKRVFALESELERVDNELALQTKAKKDALAFMNTSSRTRTTQQTLEAADKLRAASKRIDELEKERRAIEAQLKGLPRTVK